MADQNQSRVAVITGAGHGLGRAMATELFRNGYNLALIDIEFPAPEYYESLVSPSDRRISLHVTDVADINAVRHVKETIVSEHGRIDMLINNAAISNSLPFDRLDLNDFHRLFDVNFC